MYLTYESYQNMGGTLDETTFNDYEYEAETIVNWYTFNRLKGEAEYPDELARCMYRLIEFVKLKADLLLASHKTEVTTSHITGGYPALVYADVPDGDMSYTKTVETTTAPPIRSQSNDGVSISYNTIDASDLFKYLNASGKDSPLADIVFRYLQGVRNSQGKRLTYRGLYPDE